MNTHEQFITPETAKLAKQAGFDWEVKNYYYHTTVGWKLRNSRDIPEYIKGNDRCISAPTQSVLQRWLREEKGYNIYISHTYTVIDGQIKSIWEVLYEEMLFLKPNSTFILEDDFGRSLEFDIYEDALEAAEKKCLTILIENL